MNDSIRLEVHDAADLGRVDLEAVGRSVLGGSVTILRRAFDAERMDAVRGEVLAWQARTAESNPDRLSAAESYWRRDVNTPSQTPHLFETFCFVLDPGRDDALTGAVRPLFTGMQQIWERLTGQEAAIAPQPGGAALRPQIIHYPVGGGHFDWHVHALEPQRIGLIVGLSKHGRDFDEGGTVFRGAADAEPLDTTLDHDLGDVCLFRYDLEHAVSVVDGGRDLAWGDSGRWTAVLPLI